MRVLHLATTYPLLPGDSNAAFIQSIAEGLASRGHEIDMLLPWHPRLQLERPDSAVRLHAFRYSPIRAWHPWGYAQALRGDRELRRDAYLAALPAAVSAARAIRRLSAAKAYDLLHAHWLLPNAPIVAFARGRSGPPIVISCHGSDVYLAERRRWARWLARYALRRAAAVTGCSGDLTARLEALDCGPEPQRVPYGVDTSRFAPLDEDARDAARERIALRHGISAEDPWILAVGRLVHKKGFDVLVDALPAICESVESAHLIIAGSGPLGPDLRSRAAALGVPGRVHLVGALPHDELPVYYGCADLVAIPSVQDVGGNVDGLPNTLMEGLASGTPLVASRVAGIPDVVRDGDNGLLFDASDAVGLANAAIRCLSDPLLAATIGSAARADAVANLGWEHTVDLFEEIYESAVAATAGATGSEAPEPS